MKRSSPKTEVEALEKLARKQRKQRKSTLPNGFIFGIDANGDLTITNTKSGKVTIIA